MKKKEVLKRGASIALVAAMVLSMCACGGKSAAKTETSKHCYSVTYLTDLPDSFGGDIGYTKVIGDNLIYQAYATDYSGSSIYMYNILNGESTTIWENTSETLEDGTNINNNSVNYFAMDKDNNLYLYLYQSKVTEESLNQDYSGTTYDDVIAKIMDMWQETEDMAIQEWNDYFADQYTNEDGSVDYEKFMKQYGLEWISAETIMKVDASGAVAYEKEMRRTMPGEEETQFTNCTGMACDKEGNLYVAMNKWDRDGMNDEYYVDVYAPNGDSKGKITVDGYVSDLVNTPDGKVAYGDYSGDKYMLREFNPDALSVEDGMEFGNGGYSSSMVALNDEEMLIRENASLNVYNTKTKTDEKLLNFMDYNIASSSVSSIGVLSDGRIVVFSNSYNNAAMRYQADIALLTEIDPKDMPKVEYINIACMWLDSNIETQAIEFNKKHEGYHISISEYNDPSAETYDDMLKAFTTAVASDKSIDMVIFNDYSQVVNFASKGLMTDLYQFLDTDSDVNRDTLMPNVLTACELGEKLVCLPTTFSLQTVVGKVSDVGTTPGWTFDDMMKLYESKPAGTQLFYGMTRDQALRLCLNLGYKSYIDAQKATCNFNSEEFVKALEFANMFPEEFEWSEDEDSTVLMNEGKVLLSEFYLNDFAEIQMYETVFGEDLTYIGYPTTEGNGAMISLNNIYGITKNCKEPEIAWEFLRQFYLPKGETSENDYAGSYGFSVRKDEFEKYCAEAMKEREDGGWSWGWGNFEVKIQPATQEDVDAVKDLVYNATAVNGAITDSILNIINEEAAFYFSGEQSAQAVAEKIQSRMQMYLSETK